MISFDAQSQIEITQIESPHKFWYKKCNDLAENRRLVELENAIREDAADLIESGERLPINRGNEVIALHPEWGRWIRGKAGKLISGSHTDIIIWAIDYGCKLTLPLENVHLLQDRQLAFHSPINVYVGGLSGISPAKNVS